jgi:hypothetical protein
MSEKEIKIAGMDALQNREKEITIRRTGSLQPKGKLFGMDAFVWLYPGVETLSSTIQSFPFDVIWIGNGSEMEAILAENEGLESKVTNYFVIGESEFKNEKCLRFDDINDALKAIKEKVYKPGIILFTSTDSNTEYTNRQINNYLELVQVQ